MNQNRLMGVVIARFQTFALTQAHRYLLEQVATRVDRVLILLGVHPVGGTKRNPLDFSIRERMVKDWWISQWPDKEVWILPLHDAYGDEEWAARVDQLIGAVNYNSPAVIFCGPDGAGPTYSKAGGKWPVEMLDSMGGHASKMRDALTPRYTEDFRAGMIYAVERRFVNPYPTIDVLVRNNEGQTLLGQKKQDGDKWRMIGGFVDPEDDNLEAAAHREVFEEAGIEIGHPTYVGSAQVNDWRFRGGPEGILTSVFTAPFIHGAAKANDDLDAVRWFPNDEVEANLHDSHLKLFLELGLR